jgi:hypothetical protein
MGIPRAKIIIVVVLVSMASLFAWILFKSNPPGKAKVLPSPNGYDNFVKAGSLFNEVITNFYYSTVTNKSDLLLFITNNASALAEMREGLKHESLIPWDLDTNYIHNEITNLMAFKRLALTMAKEGELAEMEGRTNEAAKIYLETMEFANKSLHGGTMIDRLVAIACEYYGRRGMERIAWTLPAQESRKAASKIEELDGKWEPVQTTRQIEHEWLRRNATLRDWIHEMIERRTFNPEKMVIDSFKKKVNESDLQRRQLMLLLTSHAFELEKGRSPRTVTELVPGYLKAAPHDSSTGKELTLKP